MYSAITAPKIIINYWNWTTHTLSYNGTSSRTTQVGQYQKKHSPTHTHPVHQASFINFLHSLRSIASSLFNLRARHSFSTTSLQVLFGLPLGLGPPTSYSMHFFTQSHARATSFSFLTGQVSLPCNILLRMLQSDNYCHNYSWSLGGIFLQHSVGHPTWQ